MRRSWDSYRMLFKWEFLRARRGIPMLVVIQLLLSVGVIYGFGLLIPDIDRTSALFLATGAPTIGLMIMGLTVVPQEVSQGQLTGRHEYIFTLPVPRLAPLAATVSWWLLMQLPGTAIALAVAAARFDLHFRVGAEVIPAIVLVSLTGAAVGYGISSVVKPQLAMQLTSFLSIGILLFSPINFPADRLPNALQAVHRVLPVQYMADIMRGSLTGHYESGAAVAFAVVGAWCAASLAVSYRVALRRA